MLISLWYNLKKLREVSDMSKSKIVCLLAFFFMFALLGAEKSSTKMYINVKESWIKSGSGVFDKNIATVKYGEQVYLLQEKGKWAKISLVSNHNIMGWIPKANLTKKKIVGAFDKKTSAESKELALAGKGLTEGSGSEFSTSGRKNYEAVDSIEKINISLKDLQIFIINGSLKEGE